jgi:formate hydrogenlyase transcriptional activator
MSQIVCDGALIPQLVPLPYRFDESGDPSRSINLTELPEAHMKIQLDSENPKRANRLASPRAEESIASRYEALLSVNVVIGNHHNVDGLFCALATELLRIVDFDFIGLARYEETTRKVEWHLSRPDGGIERGTVDGTQEETMSEWVYQYQKPLVIPFLDHETGLHGKIKELANDGIQSLCAFPLTCVQQRIGSFLIGSKQPEAYPEDELRFLSLIADMIASALDDAMNFQALRCAQAELRSEKDRLRLLLELNNRVVSNLEFRELLRAVSASVRRVMECDAVAVHLPDLDKKRLQLFALDLPAGEGFLKEDALLPMDGCGSRCPCEVFRTGKPMVMRGTGTEPRCPDADCAFCVAVTGQEVRSVCALPLVFRDRVLGVLELVRRHDPAFTQADVDFMCQVSSQVAIAIENALVYQQVTELKNQLAREKLYLEDEIRSEQGFEEIIGRSAAIRAVLRKIETVASTDSTVLICGETGTGKELIARAIHERSPRHSNPFVKLNCAAIPTGLLESELFGHERGAFTGAIVQRIGRFELANRGTAFLDEIGEIALELQPKLLRVLQEREFERLGSTRTLKADARLIAATNRDLAACVEEKSFRADLFYRLNVFPIQAPPLRERSEDVPLLVRHFVQHFARRIGRSIDTIPSDTMEALVKYSWPGNIRELQNLIEHSVILSSGPVLRVPLASLQSTSALRPDGARQRTLEEAERELILETLKETKWVQSGPRGAAARLGMNRSTLQFRMKKLGIVRPGS